MRPPARPGWDFILKTSFEVSRSGSEETGNAVLTGVETMPGSHTRQEIAFTQMVKGMPISKPSGPVAKPYKRQTNTDCFRRLETGSFGGFFEVSPNLPNSEPPSSESKERFYLQLPLRF